MQRNPYRGLHGSLTRPSVRGSQTFSPDIVWIHFKKILLRFLKILFFYISVYFNETSLFRPMLKFNFAFKKSSALTVTIRILHFHHQVLVSRKIDQKSCNLILLLYLKPIPRNAAHRKWSGSGPEMDRALNYRTNVNINDFFYFRWQMNIKSLNFGRNPTGRKQCDWAIMSPPTQNWVKTGQTR